MSADWQTIDTAPKDGRFIDSYNAHNGERRVTKWVGTNGRGWGILSPWEGWDGQWGNEPTHWLPTPDATTKVVRNPPPPPNGDTGGVTKPGPPPDWGVRFGSGPFTVSEGVVIFAMVLVACAGSGLLGYVLGAVTRP